jgi:hypothetical protein
MRPEFDSARMHNLSRVRDEPKYANRANIRRTDEKKIEAHILLLDPVQHEWRQPHKIGKIEKNKITNRDISCQYHGDFVTRGEDTQEISQPVRSLVKVRLVNPRREFYCTFYRHP